MVVVVVVVPACSYKKAFVITERHRTVKPNKKPTYRALPQLARPANESVNYGLAVPPNSHPQAVL